MFTRWGEAKTGHALPEPLLAEAARIHGTPMPPPAPGVPQSVPELRIVESTGSGPPPPHPSSVRSCRPRCGSATRPLQRVCTTP